MSIFVERNLPFSFPVVGKSPKGPKKIRPKCPKPTTPGVGGASFTFGIGAGSGSGAFLPSDSACSSRSVTPSGATISCDTVAFKTGVADSKKARATPMADSSGNVITAKTEKDEVIVVKDESATDSSGHPTLSSSDRMDVAEGEQLGPHNNDAASAAASRPSSGASSSGPKFSSASFAPSSGSAFSSVSKAVKKTQQQMQQHLHPSALSSYYSTSSSSAPGGGAYYLGWNRLQEQLRNQQVPTHFLCVDFFVFIAAD